MLESMRSVQNSWIGKIGMALIFILIIVGLSFFGFADLFRTGAATWVARVGGTDVSADDYRRGYQANLQQLEQRLRRPVTNEQARQFGLDQQVLSQLVTNAVLDNEAGKLGLAISESQIAKAVIDDPTFAGANGQFDRARFTTLLSNNGLTEQSFLRDQRHTYLRQELVDGVAGAMTVPKAALDALHKFAAETRSIDMVVLQPSVVGDIPAPDDATLQKFFDERKQSFAAPEYRKLVVLPVSAASVAKPADVSDEDIRKVYDANADNRFGMPERRTVQQIAFPNEAEAEAASAQIKAGKSFATVATERNVAGKELDLGTVAKSALFDKSIADAAFSLPADGTSDPLKGTFGVVIVHVAAIEPGSMKPFDEVAPAIRQEIATAPARTRDALRAIRDKIEDQRSAGKTLSEAAAAVGVPVRTIEAIDATGHDPAGALVDLSDRDDLLRAAFASDVGVDNDIIQSRQGDEIWFEVAHVDAAHQRTFAEVKPQVEAAWRKDEVGTRLAAKAEELVKAVDAGQTMEQIAASLNNAEIKHVADLKRSGAAGVPSGVAIKAFDLPVNGAGSAEGSDGTRVLFKVLDSVVPPLDADDPQTVQLEGQYRTMFANDMLTAYLSRLEGTLNIKVNPTVMNSVTGGAS